MIMKIIAWFVLMLSGLNTLLVPLLFGKDRGKYDYKTFIANVFSFIVCGLLAARVLGWL